MCKRTHLAALAMLGLGTLVGYAAARGKLPLPETTGPSLAAAPAESGATLDGTRTAAAPARKPAFTAAGGKAWQTPKPGNARGATTGPTDAPGYNHPNQFIHMKATEIAPNMEPVIVHPTQLKEAM